jgi:Staphylococcal nuclease homologue
LRRHDSRGRVTSENRQAPRCSFYPSDPIPSVSASLSPADRTTCIVSAGSEPRPPARRQSATYDRCVGVCYLNGINIEEELVRIGLARDCPRFSGKRYREVEQAAADQGATIRETYRLPGVLPSAVTLIILGRNRLIARQARG